MCGLPARGKTYTARKICRYLSWLVFNVGNYRRKELGAQQTADFFDPLNTSFAARREQVAQLALDDLLDWLLKDGPEGSTSGLTPLAEGPTNNLASTLLGAGNAGPSSIGIYDATNSTKERRQFIFDDCTKKGVKVFFIENICTDEVIIRKNIMEVKLTSPDYVGWTNLEEIFADFQKRIFHYEQAYETIGTEEFGGKISFVKVVNIGKQIALNLVQGYLESRIVFYLMNLNTIPKSFFISRHGESNFNLEGRIGGNSDLSPRGQLFAEKLPVALKEFGRLIIWTSTLNRTIQTKFYLPEFPSLQWKQLDEISAGSCDGLTHEEIEKKFPFDSIERNDDKFNYRHHAGESYRDLVHRLEPVILELERHSDEETSIYIIAHQAVLRALYAYFHGISLEELPYIQIPLHTIIKLTPKAYGCHEERVVIDVPAVDTFRAKRKI